MSTMTSDTVSRDQTHPLALYDGPQAWYGLDMRTRATEWTHQWTAAETRMEHVIRWLLMLGFL